MASLHLWSLCVLILLSGGGLARRLYSSGESGEKCGTDQRRCLAGKASCNQATGRCVCHKPPYAYGNGMINCYRDNTFRTEVFNDPQVLTYNGNSIGLPIPCRYLLTHTVTQLKDENQTVVGSCEFQVYASNFKDYGKFFVGGFDAAIRISYNDGSSKLISVRKLGKAYDHGYAYILGSTDNAFLPNGPWGSDPFYYHDPFTNLTLGCDIDKHNNLAILEADRCGIRIQLRPYDCKVRHPQQQIPHMTYEIDRDFQPVFHSKDKVVSIPPADHFDNQTIDDILLYNLDREETLIVRALTSMAEQNSWIYPNQECARSADVFGTCVDDEARANGTHHCKFILKSPRFIKCYDPSWDGIKLMALFNNCVSIWCNGYSSEQVLQDILESECAALKNQYAEVINFIELVTPVHS